MAQGGYRIDSGEACLAADGESGGGTYHAYGYLLQPGGGIRREAVSLGAIPPAVKYPAALTRDVLGRLGRKSGVHASLDNLAAVAITRLCWNEKHRLQMDRPARVERVAALVLADTVTDVADVDGFVRFGRTLQPDKGEINMPLRDAYAKRPIVYMPLSRDEANYPLTQIAYNKPADDDLAPVYVALYDKLGEQAQLVVAPDQLR